MNKDLTVMLKAHGVGLITMNLPVVSAIINAHNNDEAEFLDVIYTIADVLDTAGIAELVEEDGWDLDEIHDSDYCRWSDSDAQYGVGLYDYEGNTIVEETA